jgi:hypothetical protein
LADLTWCVAHVDSAPHAGWLREVYYQLARLHRTGGDTAKAREYLRRSGAVGHTFSPKRITEIVPGAEGKYELAATALHWAKDRFAESESLDDVERLTYLKLMEKYQEFDPFKFIIYSGRIGAQTPQMESKAQMPQRKAATRADP